jgi:hypothetical protein
MKKIITAFVFCFLCGECFSQAGEWVWVHGDTIAYSNGIFGLQGIPSATNTPPGFYEAAEWRDQQGNFWLFGGYEGNGFYGDLWRYDPTNNEWTWMKGSSLLNDTGNYGSIGIPNSSNRPYSRGYGAATWVSKNGDLWLFGGNSYVNLTNALWKYEISTNSWTWMHGSSINGTNAIYGNQGIPSPSNTPGVRWECSCTWVDSIGNLWLFGGYNNGIISNDLWKYDVNINEWTWMKGDSLYNQLGHYGVKGIADTANVPPARKAYCSWLGDDGKFWFFGGNSPLYNRSYNDMWMYNPSSNNWTWMSGTDTVNDNGQYGSKCIASFNKLPKARDENRVRWKDNCGNFWLYGGFRNNSSFNDLWSFNPYNLEWTFVNGNASSNFSPVYGIIGVSSSTNQPGSRGGANSWSNNNGDLFLFGGAVNGWPNPQNDIWKYTPSMNCSECDSLTAIQENNFTNELLVFPNPTNSSLTISFSSSEKQKIELRIYNTLGKQIYFTKEEITKGKFEKEINVAKWSEGIYFLQVKTKEGNLSRKVIVNH